MLLIVCCIQYGKTPLHYACEGGHKEIALWLVENGASVTDKDTLVRLHSRDVYAMPHMCVMMYIRMYVCMYVCIYNMIS